MTTNTTTEEVQHMESQGQSNPANSNRDALKRFGNKRDELVGTAQEKVGVIKEKAQTAAETLAHKTELTRQKVGNQRSHYNDKMEKAVDKLPGNVPQTVTRYPWVPLAAVLGLGLILGMWLKPCFKRYEYKYKYQQE